MPPELGRALWRLLHTYAWLYPDEPTAEDQRRAREWLAELSRIVGEQPGCHCSGHWSDWLASSPPDLTSRTTFYWWTVAAHNAVNVRQGKLEFFSD